MEVKLEKETEDEKKKMPSWLILVILILILGIIILLLYFCLKGQTTITGEYNDTKNTETITCESDSVSYPIFSYDNSDSKNLKINVLFDNDNVQSVALYYRLNYQDSESTKKSESVNHADMNLSFYDQNMKSDDLNAKYSFIDNSLQMSIYANNTELNQDSLRYFMIYNVYNLDKLTKEKITKIYKDAGLNCVINSTNKEVNEN